MSSELAEWHWPHWTTDVQKAFMAVYNARLPLSPDLPAQCCCAYCGRPRSNKECVPVWPREGWWAR